MFEYDIIKGDKVSEDDLELERSRNIFSAINNNSFSSILELRRNLNGDDIFILETEVEIPQNPVHDIKSREIIAIIVCSEDNYFPEVYALRKDFPSLTHQNLRLFDIPKSLCLYEESFSELKLTWSASKFIEKIRDWLRLSARGKLHADDQPLEPLLFSSKDSLIFNRKIFSESKLKLVFGKFVNSGGQTTITCSPINDIKSLNRIPFIATYFKGHVQEHGVISHTPTTLHELALLIEKAKIDLIEELRVRLQSWKENYNAELFEAPLVVVIDLPKSRFSDTPYEKVESRAFFTEKSTKEIGIDIGIWRLQDGVIGKNIPIDNSKKGENTKLFLLNPQEPFSQDMALHINNNNSKNGNIKTATIGLGSLGSQIFNLLVRQGIGKWTLIDNDIILPHNLGRHILSQEHIGQHKAKVISDFANNLYDDSTICNFFLNDILSCSNDSNPDVFDSLKSSNIIFDFSASVPVARSLCNDIISDARRISCFFTSSGKDSILIAEDKSRNNKLDMLEMVYYRAIVNNSNLNDHLFNDENKIRYGYSCRDISSRIPFDLTAQHAAFCSTEIKSIIEDSNPRISVWRTSQDNTVEKISISTTNEFRIHYGDWTLVYDKEFLDKIYNLRSVKLPKETGGILIGSHDIQRKIVYVVETIPSPPDSEEWPTSYIRGFRGLRWEVERLHKQTDGMLNYIGEWHSHPKGCTPTPSTDDLIAFKWLVEVMNEEDRPALMLIAGDTHEFFLGEMKIEKC